MFNDVFDFCGGVFLFITGKAPLFLCNLLEETLLFNIFVTVKVISKYSANECVDVV